VSFFKEGYLADFVPDEKKLSFSKKEFFLSKKRVVVFKGFFTFFLGERTEKDSHFVFIINYVIFEKI
jgi:hypothetical protein